MDEWNDYEDGEEEESSPAWKRPAVWAAAAAVVIALVAVGYVVLKKNNDSGSAAAGPTSAQASVPAASTTVASSTTAAGASTSGAPTSAAVTTTAAPTTTASTTTEPESTVAPTTADSTYASTPAAAPVDTAAPTTESPAAAPAGATYNTLPDGSPAPIIAVFSTENVTLSGAVPDQASKDKLQALAIANSKFPVPVNNLLTIDPTVPPGIGVRVVELTSARFDPNSAVVQGPHALELDRVVSVLNALPNVTALVIGHADQIGSDEQNYKISAARATAVVNYMVSKGVSPSRLSSRAVGDNDLITLNDDAASLALNRRTEFVLYGLLGP